MTQADLFATLPPIKAPRFDGHAYVAGRDQQRLNCQLQRVLAVVIDGEWRTIEQISRLARAPENSASAQLRNLRKPRFGGYLVEKEHAGGGLFRYRVLPGGKP